MSEKQTAATVKDSLTTGDRERFEYWASDDGEYPKTIERDGSGYKLGKTQAFWLAWHQCSTKSPAIAVIESQAAEIERLQRIIDSRPAINAGLVEAYVKWTSSIYAMDIMNATETKQ